MKIMKVKQADGSVVSIPLGLGTGGGYYIPSVIYNGDGTITISFTPSLSDMPAVDSVTFNAGVNGDIQAIEEMLQGFDSDPGSVKAYVDAVAGTGGGSVSDEQIASAVEKYLQENPIDTSESERYAENAQQSADEARASAESAEAAADRAESADTAAEQSAENAAQSWASAENAKIAANKAKEDAEVARDDANDAQASAEAARDTAKQKAAEASNSAQTATNAKNEVQALKTEVEQKLANGDYNGSDGKSAYEYAQEGGYTGTEAEFTAKLSEQSTSSQISEHNTNTSSHSDIRTAIDGKANKSEGTFYIEGSGTTNATNKVSTWLGTSDRITSYYDGLTIRYKISIEGQSTTTLNINNLGEKTVYRFGANKLTTQFPVGSIVHLIYHESLNGGCWMCSDYDSNTNAQQYVETDPTVPEWAKSANKPVYNSGEISFNAPEDSNPIVSRGTVEDALMSIDEYLISLPSWSKQPSKPTYTKTDVGLGNVDNVKQYSASNPPPYPVTSVNGQTGAVSLSASDICADPAGSAQAVAQSVANDLLNYYKKSETYGKTEINNLVSSIPKFSIEVVNSAWPPDDEISETTVYLKRSDTASAGDMYDEYIYVNGVKEKLGTQTFDLTGYVTETDLTNALNSYALASDVPTKTSELINDSNFAVTTNAETWTFTLADGSTVTKRVVLA